MLSLMLRIIAIAIANVVTFTHAADQLIQLIVHMRAVHSHINCWAY